MFSPKPYEPTSERVSEDDYQAREGDYLIYLFHLATYDFALSYVEGRRVLTDDGVFLVATPDHTTRLFRGQRPWNRNHLVEHAPDELVALLGQRFPVVEAFGLGGDPAVIGRELTRSRRLKWATLLFTFPGAPEPWRQRGLAALKRIEARLRRSGGQAAVTGEPEGVAGGAGDVPVTPPRTPSM